MSLERNSKPKLIARFEVDNRRQIAYIGKYLDETIDEIKVKVIRNFNPTRWSTQTIGANSFPPKNSTKEITELEYITLIMTNGVIHEKKVL
jgi:uncharacterized protein YtpQ (UPF0354 family)